MSIQSTLKINLPTVLLKVQPVGSNTMKLRILIIVLLAISSLSCRRQSTFSMAKSSSKEIIAIQPLEGFNISMFHPVINEISRMYGRRVIVFQPLRIPAKFIHQITKNYSADSILTLLSRLKNDTM